MVHHLLPSDMNVGGPGFGSPSLRGRGRSPDCHLPADRVGSFGCCARLAYSPFLKASSAAFSPTSKVSSVLRRWVTHVTPSAPTTLALFLFLRLPPIAAHPRRLVVKPAPRWITTQQSAAANPEDESDASRTTSTQTQDTRKDRNTAEMRAILVDFCVLSCSVLQNNPAGDALGAM